VGNAGLEELPEGIAASSAYGRLGAIQGTDSPHTYTK